MPTIKDMYFEMRSVVIRCGWTDDEPTEELKLKIRGDIPLGEMLIEVEKFLRAAYYPLMGKGHLDIVEDSSSQDDQQGVDSESTKGEELTDEA